MQSPLPLEVPSSRVRVAPRELPIEEVDIEPPPRPLGRDLASPRWSRATVLSFCFHLAVLLFMAWSASKQGTVPWGQAGAITATLASEADEPNYFDDENSSEEGGAAAQAVAISPSDAASEEATDSPFPDEPPPVDTTGKLPARTSAASSDAEPNSSQTTATELTQGEGTGRGTGQGSGLDRALEKGKGRTSVFGLTGEGYKFVYVFDRSGSMGGSGVSPLMAAKKELLASLDHLEEVHQFQIIFYNEKPTVFNLSGAGSPLVFGTEANKETARRFVESIPPDGGTAHLPALLTALDMAPDVVFFLTDADQPALTPKQMKQVESRNRGGKTTIHAIEFGIGPQVDRNNFLVRLAKQNNGQHTYFDVTRLGRGSRK